MARPAITYKETFKCPKCGKEQTVYIPNTTVWHPCRSNNKVKVTAFNSIDVWTKEQRVYKQCTLNL